MAQKCARHTRLRLNRCKITSLFVQVFLIIAAVFAVIVYRLAIKAVFAVSVDLTSIQDVGVIGQFATPQMLTTITASCISLVVIMILNKVMSLRLVWDRRDNVAFCIAAVSICGDLANSYG